MCVCVRVRVCPFLDAGPCTTAMGIHLWCTESAQQPQQQQTAIFHGWPKINFQGLPQISPGTLVPSYGWFRDVSMWTDVIGCGVERFAPDGLPRQMGLDADAFGMPFAAPGPNQHAFQRPDRSPFHLSAVLCSRWPVAGPLSLKP